MELRCKVPDNCPEMKPIVSWTNNEDLAQNSVYGRVEEESGTWTTVSLLKFLPLRENNRREVGCTVTYANTTFEFEGFSTLSIRCELAVLLKGGCQCDPAPRLPACSGGSLGL